jgi:hypothetical protein
MIKHDIFNFDENRKAAFLEDVLTHNARQHVIHGVRQARCLENVVAAYGEFLQNKPEYRQAAREDFEVCLAAHFDMKQGGFL